jgi:hypothetical protein
MVKLLSVAACATLMVMLNHMARASPRTTLLTQLRETIRKVRTMSGPSMARTSAAEHLSQLTKKIDPNEVDDKTLADLVSLLDTSDDSVRGWVAGALGYLGPRAKAAVPKLLNILPQVDCLNVSLSSAPAIRLALNRIGVTAPPPPNCETKVK